MAADGVHALAQLETQVEMPDGCRNIASTPGALCFETETMSHMNGVNYSEHRSYKINLHDEMDMCAEMERLLQKVRERLAGRACVSCVCVYVCAFECARGGRGAGRGSPHDSKGSGRGGRRPRTILTLRPPSAARGVRGRS